MVVGLNRERHVRWRVTRFPRATGHEPRASFQKPPPRPSPKGRESLLDARCKPRVFCWLRTNLQATSHELRTTSYGATGFFSISPKRDRPPDPAQRPPCFGSGCSVFAGQFRLAQAKARSAETTKANGRLDRWVVFLLARPPVCAKAAKAKPRHLSESCRAGPGRQAVTGFVVGLFPCVARRAAAARSLWCGFAPGYRLCAGGFACHGSIAKTPALGGGFGAGSGTRTRTGEDPQRILSPLRLPIPPSRLGSASLS